MAKSLVWPLRGQDSVGLVDVPVVVECTEAEDMARQEYKLQSDLSYQVQRFGTGHKVQFGVIDFDNSDLTRAFELVAESRDAWLRLPKVIRDRYHSWPALEAAIVSGEADQLLKAAGVAADAVAAAKPAASPSDSAAGGASAPVAGS